MIISERKPPVKKNRFCYTMDWIQLLSNFEQWNYNELRGFHRDESEIVYVTFTAFIDDNQVNFHMKASYPIGDKESLFDVFFNAKKKAMRGKSILKEFKKLRNYDFVTESLSILIDGRVIKQ